MMLLEFDSAAFGDMVQNLTEERGAKERMLAVTGIPRATFYRMLKGTPVRQIDVILSAAAYLGLTLSPYVKTARKFH